MTKHRSIRMFLAIMLAMFPTYLVRIIANAKGHQIASGTRIGFSIILSNRIVMERGSSIGHFSVVNVDRILLRKGARIGHVNFCSGPFSIWLKARAVIGNRNTVTRARKGVSTGPAQIRLGTLSKITASHSVDVMSSVIFGEFSTLAGKGSQIWSHGYVHDETGAGRYRVDGRVLLGNNVYVGSSSLITGGVTIADQIIVGVGVSVAKSLHEPGLYVSAPIRMVPRPVNPEERDVLARYKDPLLSETVYYKSHEHF